MATRVYRMTLTVSEKDLTTVLGVLTNAATLVSLTPEVGARTPNQSAKRPRRTFSYVNGRKYKGISGADLLMSELADQPRTVSQLTQAFVARGFAPKSFSPCLSAAIKQGTAVRDKTLKSLIHKSNEYKKKKTQQ